MGDMPLLGSTISQAGKRGSLEQPTREHSQGAWAEVIRLPTTQRTALHHAATRATVHKVGRCGQQRRVIRRVLGSRSMVMLARLSSLGILLFGAALQAGSAEIVLRFQIGLPSLSPY
jgi:hypothetical protein